MKYRHARWSFGLTAFSSLLLMGLFWETTCHLNMAHAEPEYELFVGGQQVFDWERGAADGLAVTPGDREDRSRPWRTESEARHEHDYNTDSWVNGPSEIRVREDTLLW